MNREVVIYRTRSGIVRAIEAHCPHLGAHFGYGGKVVGEELRCPFHGLGFSVSGSCVYSPQGPPPPAARLQIIESREVCGAIMLWHGPAGAEPWELREPESPYSWGQIRYGAIPSSAPTQEMVENFVDYAHFLTVHRIPSTNLMQPISFSGHTAQGRIEFVRPLPFKGGIRIQMDIRAQGLGFVVVNYEIGGVPFRLLALNTPASDVETMAYVGSAVAKVAANTRAKLSRKLVAPLLGRLIHQQTMVGIREDKVIWDHRKYLSRPAIAAGDGPIAEYRAWASQFYPETAD
ncbi:Rieske 2Fe-2S domain-containing protein [Mycobacterium vicinigordonae]